VHKHILMVVIADAGNPERVRQKDKFGTRQAELQRLRMLVLQVARNAADKVRPGGTLLFMGGTGGRASASGSRRQSPLHSQPSRRTWHSSSRPSE